MGKIISNGINYSGLIQANGCFIDTDNVIVSETTFRSSLSYTASQDCYIKFYLVGKANTTTSIKIDDGTVYSDWQSSVKTYATGLYVKKGQVVTVTNADSTYDSSYTVYGLQQGSPITFLSEYASACYDTNEREVGCWIDGKPLYQKTVHISALPSTPFVETTYSHGIADIDTLCNIYGVARWSSGGITNVGARIYITGQTSSSSYIPLNGSWQFQCNKTNIIICVAQDRSSISADVTIQYTKTTDTAGSGKLTPTAMPTVHYDGNEKVIGTWFGETLYEKTIKATGSFSAGSEVVIALPTGADKVRITGGFINTATDFIPLNLSFGTINTTSNGTYCYVNKSTGIHLYSHSWAFTEYAVTIQYTKTS